MKKHTKAAFYCHGFHTPCSQSEYLRQMKKHLKAYPALSALEIEVFHQKTLSGRSERMRLEAAIRDGVVGAVVTLEGCTISPDWNIFGKFMAICEEHGVPVFCLE